jgi:hypothetical protein
LSKYILALHNSNNKLKIRVNSKSYYIYVDNQKEIFLIPHNDFRLKEKLFILNYPLDVVWVPISDIEYDFLRAFHSFIKPKHLVIKPVDGKVIIDINKFV